MARSVAMRFLYCLLLLPVLALGRDLDSAKLQAIQPAMAAAVKARQAAGIVTLVMQDGKVVHHEAAGLADIAKGRAMDKEALFWIASMTKSVNAAAILMLVDEGKLSLDEPASKWLPDLGHVKLADGSAPKQPVTLRLLLSHTAGIAFPGRKATDGIMPLKDYVAFLVAAPLAFEPGSAYEYGFGPTVAGRILEIASGMKYEDFLAERLFKPLGMKDTTFHPNEAQRARIARTYTWDAETKALIPAFNPFVTADATVRRTAEPAGGLFATAADMGTFYAMIANNGEWHGKRLLSEKAVKEMTTPVSAGGKPLNYALGWQCNTQAQRTCKAMPVGSFGHGGAFATNGWVDPASKIVTVFLVQNVLVPDSGKPRDAMQALVMEAAGIEVPAPMPKKVVKR